MQLQHTTLSITRKILDKRVQLIMGGLSQFMFDLFFYAILGCILYNHTVYVNVRYPSCSFTIITTKTLRFSGHKFTQSICWELRT